MSRQASIPEHLHNAIVKRWLDGASATDIASWIEQTNKDRKEPVQTSRTSIQRLLKTVAEANSVHARLQVVQRARAGAPGIMDEMQGIRAAMGDCIAEALRSDVPVDAKRLSLTSTLLMRQHTLLHRELKLANITGEAGDKLEEEFGHLIERRHAEVQAQDARTAEGIAPEEGETPLTLVIADPEPEVLEEAAAAATESPAEAADTAPASPPTEALPEGLPESLALLSKLISDVIRADSPRPNRRRQRQRAKAAMA